MGSHSRAEGLNEYVPLPISLVRRAIKWKANTRCTVTGCTNNKRGADYLQYGKLAGSDDEDGSEHEPNTGSKHGRGC